jgi:divalent metal cation (Fe/Co/Zn/Cd) transporter
VLSFIIFFAGAQLFITSAKKYLQAGIRNHPPCWPFTLQFFIAGKLFLLLSVQDSKSRQSHADSQWQNMQNDVLISCSVLLGLIFIYIFKIPMIDTIAALLVSLWHWLP